MKKEACANCDPYPADPRHILEQTEKYTQFLEDIILSFVFLFERLFPWYQRGVLFLLWNVGSFLRIILEKEITDENILGSRAKVVFQETHSLNIAMKQVCAFSRKTNFFSLKRGKKFFIVEAGLPLVDALSSRYRLHQVDDKYFFKKLLVRKKFPYAAGRSFFCKQKAFRYGTQLGFPLAVKPQAGSLSMHVTCNIQSKEELKKALDVAFLISIACIVERHIFGDVYRMTLIRGKMVACCRREAPNIIGDGVHSIRELIEEKNKDPRRGDVHDRTKTLHRLSATPNMFLDVIPAPREKIYLHSKVILAAGADIHDVTDNVHPEMQKICERLASILNVPLLGFDFICTDVHDNPREQPCAILEANTTPFIDMHHCPVTGTPRNVARMLLEAQFE